MKLKIKESSISEDVIHSKDISLIIGISINNSYFKEGNIKKLLMWASLYSSSIYIMIPDEPMVHTLIACGNSKEKSERISRLKANSLENKCSRLIKELSLRCVTIIRWDYLINNKEYLNTFSQINKAYEQDISFNNAIRKATIEVLKNNSILEITIENINIGVEFFLKELAFITYSNLILKVKDTAYVYHKTTEILRDIIYKNYYFHSNSNVDFIVKN